MSEKKWVVYLVRCSDNSIYCGISNNLKLRLIEHNSGKGAKYTRSRRPVVLVGVGPEMTKSEALKLEYRIKQLPANEKLAVLTENEKGMAISKRDLQALNRDIQALEKTIDRLIAAVEKGHLHSSVKIFGGSENRRRKRKENCVRTGRRERQEASTMRMAVVCSISCLFHCHKYQERRYARLNRRGALFRSMHCVS